MTLPEGSTQTPPEGTTEREIAESIGPGLVRDALVIKVSGEVRDLGRPITEDVEISIFTWDEEKGKETS